MGVDLVTTSKQDYQDSFWLQQAYGKINWKSLQMSVGINENYRSVIADPFLSLGDMATSNNARPNPEVRISIPEFTPIPLTGKNIYIKGDFGFGYFLDDSYYEKIAETHNQNYTTGVLSHSKSIYLRFGNIERHEKGVQFIVGADHSVQWGGTYHSITGESFKMASDFDALTKTLTFSKNSNNHTTQAGTIRTLTENSHFIALNAKADYGTDYGENIYSIYYQHPIDNKEGLEFKNSTDMLVGVQYKSQYKKLLSGFLFEFFHTKNQNATIGEDGRLESGLNNYYNSFTYLQGRSYYGMSLGTALFLSPRYNTDGYLGFISNRIFALHGALEGYLTNEIKYSMLGTFGESRGTYVKPFLFRKRGLAGVLNVTYMFEKIPGFSITASGAFNTGYFFETETYGGSISIKKTGKIF